MNLCILSRATPGESADKYLASGSIFRLEKRFAAVVEDQARCHRKNTERA
jgi:hypothetical protein